MIRIVLADVQTMVRQGVRALLEAQADFSLVGEASDGPDAVRRVDETHPDVVILDLAIPGRDGFDVIEQIHDRSPDTRVVVLSMHDTEAYVIDSLDHGALGFVLKDASASDLFYAVREASLGRRYLSPALSERAIDAYVKRAGVPGRRQGDKTSPTRREKQVLQLCADGFTAAEIGVRLGMSPRTAETHRANLMRKLGLHSQAELIVHAFQKGLVAVEGGVGMERPEALAIPGARRGAQLATGLAGGTGGAGAAKAIDEVADAVRADVERGNAGRDR